MNFSKAVLAASLCLGILAVGGSPATATTYVLTNQNSEVTIFAGDSFGMGEWGVDGQKQLNQQQFWYRNGSSSRERVISSLNLISANQPADNLLDVVYGNSSFSIEINYILSGGLLGSGSSTIGEQIKITNLSNDPLDFHFFQYVDFDLGGSDAGDTLVLNQNLMGLFDSAYQTKGNFYFADEIISPGANRGQVNEQTAGLVLLHSLNDNAPTTLNNFAGPVTGDAAWALQWDVNIPVGGHFQIAISKSAYVTPIPEPTSLGLLTLGGVLLAFSRKQNRLANK